MDEDDMDELPEMVELPEDEEPDVIDTPDGGAIVKLDDDQPERSEDFYANLAETMPESELSTMAADYLDLIGKDREARKKRDEQYEEGIRRTGLGDDAPGGAQFEGATRVVHPMLTEACVDFAARAIKELFPPQGPVKDFIPGDPTIEKLKKAKRKTDFMNWQLTVQATEFRAELEQLLTQVPLGGAQYMKVTWNEARNRPEFLFVAIDDMYLPFSATNFYSAQRKTHVQYLTQLEFTQRVKRGMYRDVDLTPVTLEPDFSAAEKANNKIEGRTETSYNEDGLRTVYEIYVIADIEDDGEALPYIISVDKSTSKVLSIYRNWDELDEAQEELQWFVEFPFVPWRGAYPIGLPHMVGGISAAATGALRALLDSAHISNSQTMLKLKGGSKGGQSLEIQPTQVMEIEGGLAADDIRKLIMPLPYNQPSPVLFSLLGFLVDAGKGVIRTSMEDIADGNANAPVGTTLAKIEQGMVVFSAIHARMHNSMQKMLGILHRLNAMYLDDEDIKEEIGEQLATREDFEGPLDVVPVSDPNIFSEAQRFAQVQAVAQRAAALPQLYDQRAVEERILETLKIPNAQKLLLPPTTPKEQNAVNENLSASLGRPVVAFPAQDHIAHLKTHLAYMMNPALGMSPLIAPAYLPLMLNHLKEHIALWYVSSVLELAEEVAGEDVTEQMKELKTPEARQAFDRMLAEASLSVTEQAPEVFASLPPVIQQVQQMIQQLQQPGMPQDPRLALEQQKMQLQQQDSQQRAQIEGQKMQANMQMEQVKMQANMQLEQAKMQADVQRDQQRAQLEGQKMQADGLLEQQRMQLEAAKAQIDMQLEQMRQDREDQRKKADLDARMAMNLQDNQTAMQLAAAEIASGERFGVSTGTGINPQP
jgi:hypothetical protein